MCPIGKDISISSDADEGNDASVQPVQTVTTSWANGLH